MRPEKASTSWPQGSATELERSEMLALAVDAAFDVLGPDMKRKLLYHLDNRYGIAVGKGINPTSLKTLKSALVNIVGVEGAKILMKQIYLEVYKLVDDTME